MTTRTLPILACLAVVPLAACNKPGVPPAGMAATVVVPAGSPAPGCTIVAKRDVKLGDGTELRVWDLQAAGLKQLTARLLIATDGKVEPANEVEYKWSAWGPDAKPATGQLVLLIQDGKPFGVKGKRLPLLGLDLDGSPSYARTGVQRDIKLEGDLKSRTTSSSYTSPLGRRTVLYSQLFVKPDDPGNTFSLGSDPDTVAASSKGGRTVVAVTLEWAPQE